MKKNVISLAAAAAAALAATSTFAGMINVSNSGFASATNTVDFESTGLSFNTVVGTIGGVTFGGMVFKPNDTACNDPARAPAITGDGCIGNFPPEVQDSIPAGTNPWTMIFGNDIGSLAFGLSTNTFGAPSDETSVLIELFDGAFDAVSEVATATVFYSTPTGASKFVQVTGFTFDRVRVTVDLPGTLPDIMLVDNLQFSPPSNDVPEPSTLALAAIAVGSLWVAGGRRQRRLRT